MKGKELFFSLRKRGREACGAPDLLYAFLVICMLVFGAAMSYSASAVYGEQFYGDGTYFFKRYVLFTLLSVLAVIPFILFAKPAFWRVFGV